MSEAHELFRESVDSLYRQSVMMADHLTDNQRYTLVARVMEISNILLGFGHIHVNPREVRELLAGAKAAQAESDIAHEQFETELRQRVRARRRQLTPEEQQRSDEFDERHERLRAEVEKRAYPYRRED